MSGCLFCKLDKEGIPANLLPFVYVTVCAFAEHMGRTWQGFSEVCKLHAMRSIQAIPYVANSLKPPNEAMDPKLGRALAAIETLIQDAMPDPVEDPK